MTTDMKRIFGYFNEQNKDKFPVDMDTFLNFEKTFNLVEKIAGICGPLAILWENQDPNSDVKKVLWFHGRIVPLTVNVSDSDTIYLHQATETVTAGDDTYTYHYWYADASSTNYEAQASAALFSKLPGVLADVRKHMVPQGAIMMWSGTISNIPAGWALCDGTNGTPNLSGKFIVGYDSSDSDYDSIGETGGAKTVTLTANQSGLPAHIHKVDTCLGTSINFHTLASGTNNVGTANTATTQAYSTDGNTSYANGKNASQAHENRPPYYVLAYIIKTAALPA